MKRIFIAGPMNGYPQWNYPAFHDAERRLRATHTDAKVTNPAHNHNGQTDLPRWRYITGTLDQLRGLSSVQHSSSEDCFVVVLDGWQDSPGARLEAEAAHQMGMPIYRLECVLDPHWDDRGCRIIPALPAAHTLPACEGDDPGAAEYLSTLRKAFPRGARLADTPVCEEPHETIEEEDACEAERLGLTAQSSKRATILDEAKQLITGDRNNQYGPPGKDFNRAANALTALGFGKENVVNKECEVLNDHDIAIIMIVLKLSRLMWSPEKLDSWVDVAGYAGCGGEVAGAE